MCCIVTSVTTQECISKKSKIELTLLQARALTVIRDYIVANKVSPTYDEVAAGMRTTKSNARHFVNRLIRLGMLSNAPGRFRNIVITPRGYRAAARGEK